MKPSRKILVSTGVVGVVLAGGISITATAFAGRLDQTPKAGTTGQGSDSRADSGTGQVPPAEPGQKATVTPEPPADLPDVVSSELAEDPGEVGEYWTTERLENAEPMPMPEVSISIITPGN
ncbi:hypothetical protein JOL79_10125 [Microbispora sp. RL4-1S]|uniref:Uncharacterized protein n=1 Tax=Microbispora oryzae TaxID=2806554 RepID=A0A940WJ25_9ACTN|nr:hypothetical protein [Microbispora oryzae]MBP2704167.1 hypothetical protein [Microbispora oryzae]